MAVRDEAFFFRVIKGAFLLRRKTLSNSLSAALPGWDKAAIADAIAACGLPASRPGRGVDVNGVRCPDRRAGGAEITAALPQKVTKGTVLFAGTCHLHNLLFPLHSSIIQISTMITRRYPDMSTKAYYPRAEIGPGQVGFSKTRSIIEAPFYGNNVIKVNTLREAYELAKNSPGTVVTDMPVYRGEEFGLEPDAKVLLFNDGSITGRYAPARRITGKPGVDTAALDKIVMDAVYDTRWKTMYHAEVFIGLDPEFMVKAHLLIPEGEENLLYNWMLNFQYMSDGICEDV